ncbi:DNA helicase [Tanacetum coccineum]
MEERSYNREELAQEMNILVPKLNANQRKTYDLIMNAVVTGKIVLAVASSGIASLLLPNGRTSHSRFRLPLELTDESICKITKNTHVGHLLAQTDLIIWDESPMNYRRCFETLDMTLKDIMDSPEKLFGGKTVVLGENMRLLQPGRSEAEQSLACSFASWLLDIGNGKIGEPDADDSQNSFWVTVPERYCIPDDNNGLSNLINFIYNKDTLQHPTAQ